MLKPKGKLIIFSAPSGSGKSTLINHLMSVSDKFEFSISATSRAPRGTEQNGKEYYFLTPDEFRAKIANHEFLEWEEVYPDKFYGTLLSEVERINAAGKVAIFDVDVKGGRNIKKFYKKHALSVFIKPPSIAELKRRLVNRGTDAPEVIKNRIKRASMELTYAKKFDKIVVNDDLETAKKEIVKVVSDFVGEI
ncbi:MAG: guanylate kinase [Paludibacteraceae bacterium]|nr:guanylate kinase [Paludibacteraceae bacterium]